MHELDQGGIDGELGAVPLRPQCAERSGSWQTLQWLVSCEHIGVDEVVETARDLKHGKSLALTGCHLKLFF